MHDLLIRKTTGLDIPLVTIPNWAELESVSPSSRSENKLLEELGLRDKFVLLYAGNLGHPNDLESMVECADTLRDNPEVHFVFLGAGVKRKWLESQIGNLELRNVTLLDPRPRAEQRVFLNACDIGVVSLVSKMLGVSMPSRNLQYTCRPVSRYSH
jgi:glycosyltransferase involved in cell wall biosynthesis